MLTLGIETSCDETSAAVLSEDRQILSNIVMSQYGHAKYGGVVPELASRAHIRKLLPAIDAALSEAEVKLEDIDLIAVTRGPGLAGCLHIGVSAAKGISLALGVPFIGIHHLEGHIFSVLFSDDDTKWSHHLGTPHVVVTPLLCLIVSGGHTQIVSVPELGTYLVVGSTRDDAAGEAFDKVAKILDLIPPEGPVMGGPIISDLSKTGDPKAIHFPRGMLHEDGYEFSFSGLKTAVLRYTHKHPRSHIQEQLPDISASFQEAVADVLVKKTISAACAHKADRVAVVGGVAANYRLRELMSERAAEHNIRVLYPPLSLCTDNAAMIAAAGAFRFLKGQTSGLDLSADPRLKLEEI